MNMGQMICCLAHGYKNFEKVMESKILSRRTRLAPIITGFVVFFPVIFVYFIPRILIQSESALIVENITPLPIEERSSFSDMPVWPTGKPVRLTIPGINVNAHIEYVGLIPGGAMDVPKKRANVAWFSLGSRPGDGGSAVIAGHYGRENKTGSVFDNLHKLKRGDKLYVEDEKGVIISFVVRESRRYDPSIDANEVFGSSDRRSHLNLVTCEGDWDEYSQQYPKRLVVFTDRI